MVRHKLREWLPRPDGILTHPRLQWIRPALDHPRLWHLGRRSVALGTAIGLFFGIFIPFGQIPLASLAAIALRANLPVAIAGTFVTNPVTYVPIYALAYGLGRVALNAFGVVPLHPNGEELVFADLVTSVDSALRFIAAGSIPLLVGVTLLSLLVASIGYGAVRGLWGVFVLRAWRRRAHG